MSIDEIDAKLAVIEREQRQILDDLEVRPTKRDLALKRLDQLSYRHTVLTWQRVMLVCELEDQ